MAKHTVTAEFDIVAEDGLDVAAQEAQDRGCRLEVIEHEGPGGGNPFVRITGFWYNVAEVLQFWGIETWFDEDGETHEVTADALGTFGPRNVSGLRTE